MGMALTPAVASADPLQGLRALTAVAETACNLWWVGDTGSTNADLLAAAKSGALQGPTLLAAGAQTAGRGRQGRPWHDVVGGSVLCSIAWPFAPRATLGPLSLAVGVWLAEALHTMGAPDARLKWPNDLLLPRDDPAQPWAKLGGVLVEVADTAQARWAVVGFGINLRTPRDTQSGGLPPTGLDAAHLDLPLAVALPALAGPMLAGLQQVGAAQDLKPVLARWAILHAWSDQPVAAVEHGKTVLTGIARGLAPDGALLVETASGTHPVHSADVSLRLHAATTHNS